MEFLSNIEYKSILGYLPATIIKNVIETKVALTEKLPRHYVTESVGLFSDISGFTKLSEAFSKKGRVGPEFLTFCINRYMERIINIIGANGGDIFKFVGDAIMVIWPPDGSPNFLKNACKRACQCAMDIQRQLNDLEIIEGKKLSVKIGLGVGQCHILFVGGLFGRCEYLCVGECMRQACESETHSEHGGQVLMSEKVRENVEDGYFFKEAEVQPGYKKNDNLKYYLITGEKSQDKTGGTTKKADAFLMRKMFDIKRVREKVVTLRQFLPAGVKGYLNIEKEDWCKEIRLVSLMFLNIKVDLSQLKGESDYMKVQIIANTVQRSIYRTRGALNKFLLDDKGSVMLVAWGLPPMSSRNDPLDAVCSCITILHEFDKLGFQCAMGLTTGTCFTGVCGTVGNRREYSMLGEVVNLASRYMSEGLKYMAKNKMNNILVIDERTKNLIQNKIRCKYLFRTKVKGFDILFNFFTPVTEENDFFPKEDDPFPFIRTHCCNPVPFYNVEQFFEDQDEEVKKKRINNQKNYLKNSLEMAGRIQEFEAFVTKLNEIYKKKLKKFIMIKGHYGCGKSFFIRKGLYSFFKDIESNQELSDIYFNNPNLAFPNFVLCNYQTPMLEHIPFNGVSMIFRQIYLWLTKNYFKKENSLVKINLNEFDKDENNKYPFNTIIGDEMAKLICKNNCLEHLEAIEEMLATSKEDIQLKIHFGDQDYIDKVIPFIEEKKNLEKKNSYAKPRDPYFSNLEIKQDINIINFLMELLILYKNQINKLKDTDLNIPLFLIIEDTHFVDKYTISFINKLLYDDIPVLKPLIVILSYQEEFHTLKRRNDLMIKEKQFLNKMSLNEFKKNNKETIVNNLRINNITSIQEIEEFIKIYVLENDIYERFDSLFKVDPNLIRTLIDKSYGGNPLLIRDLLEEFLRMKCIQNCVSEILITSELDDMEKLRNWNEFNIPIRIEKICGEMIDSLPERDIIMLKHAATIGNLFDIQTLLSILPFKGMTLPDLYSELKKIEKRGMIEILYDLDHKKKTVVFKFCCPFLKETLYQRMLIEQRNDIHMQIARLIQKNQVSYLPNLKLEKLNLRKQLENGQKSIIKEMEEPPADDNSFKDNKEVLNINSLKILIVKEICDKLKYMKSYSDDEIEQVEGKDKLAQALKYGMVEKKSDGKITWENRFFVLTAKNVSYYYHLDEYISDKVPLAMFELKDIYELKQLSDSLYGNKKNIFKVSVSRWKKKEQIKGKRSYIFSCRSLEDLYSWIITINFLKVNAYYNIFTSHFGKIGLPLYKFHGRKPKKFFFNLDDKQYLYNNEVKSALSTKENLTNSQKKKVNIPLERAVSLPEVQKKVANLVSNVFLCILGDIQYRLAKFHNDTEQDESEIKEIAVPPHLKSCENLRDPEDEDENSKFEEEEEDEKSASKEDKKEEEKNMSKEDIKEEEEEKEENNKNEKSVGSKGEIISSDKKINKELIISEKISEGEKLINNEEKLKNKKSEISDLTDFTKNNNKLISKEENNEEEKNNSSDDFDDIDDMDFDMNEEEADTHYPKYFIKDKSIIQLNDYPESMNEMNNHIIDSQN